MKLKYSHIYLPVLFGLWPVLYMDSVRVATTFAYGQTVSTLLVLAIFLWIYRSVSRVVQRLMLYGLVIALGGEAFFSLLLGMYTYRLENVPPYVPFGHTIIYASIYYLIREPIIIRFRQQLILTLSIGMTLYASAWLLAAHDLFGFLCTMMVLWMFRRHPNTRLFFSAMYFMVVYLELIGTHFQCWAWPEVWFGIIDAVPSANPPSGIGFFYFGFDLGCLWVYKKLYPQQWRRMRRMQRRLA